MGRKMQVSRPKLEAKMAKIWTATMNLPRVLRYAGTKEIHTMKKTNMPKVTHFASLEDRGRNMLLKELFFTPKWLNERKEQVDITLEK